MSGGVHSSPRVPPSSETVVGEVTADQGTPNTLANAWPVEVTDGTNVLGTAAHPLHVDPTGTTPQPVTGTVTANQGTAAALAGAWPVEVTDGTNVLGTAAHPIRNDPTGTTAQPVSFPPPTGGTALQPNWYIPRTAHLASAALPGAGAFTNQAAQTLPPGTKKVSFWITYTRGAAGGYPQFELLWSNGTEEIRHVIGNQSSLVQSQPNGQFNTLQSQFIGPQPQSGSALVYGYTFSGEDVPAGATTVRLIAAELGVTATPGTCAITLTAEG